MITRIPRTVTFLPGLAAAWWGWHQLAEPFRLEGLAGMEAAAVVSWPLIVLAVVFILPALLLAPLRPARKWWRHRPWWLFRNDGREYARSARISDRFRQLVFYADWYRCSACKSSGPVFHLDHLIPWSLGGCTILANAFTLCETCNLAKSNAMLFRGRFWAGSAADPALAEAILRAERRHRWNLYRWLRAAWALGT